MSAPMFTLCGQVMNVYVQPGGTSKKTGEDYDPTGQGANLGFSAYAGWHAQNGANHSTRKTPDCLNRPSIKLYVWQWVFTSLAAPLVTLSRKVQPQNWSLWQLARA